MARQRHIAVYATVNMNVIDGSSIWLQSLVQTLLCDPRNRISVVLKAAEERDILTKPLRRDRVEIIDPIGSGRWEGPELSVNRALDTLEELDGAQPVDLFIMRGYSLCLRAATRRRPTFRGRLWAYLTDIPQRPEDLTPEHQEQLGLIAEASRYLLCQTEQLRAFLEAWIPASINKCVLLGPMIPPVGAREDARKTASTPFRLIYTGKFAPLWNTLEMTWLVTQLRRLGRDVELHMVGDKIHRDRAYPRFYEDMERALRTTEGLVWHGGQPRQKVFELLRTADLALSWRSRQLDDSLELSTKVLEYGATGLPLLLNRTPMHEDLLGADYPMFASSFEEAVSAVERAIDDPQAYEAAQSATLAASARFSFPEVYERLEPFIDRVVSPMPGPPSRGGPVRLLLASHDWKFFTRIEEFFRALDGVEVRRDEWAGLRDHDESRSRELLEWADVIICEWCAGNAIWYSHHKKRYQRLIVRFHRFEIDSPYPGQVALDNVDWMIFVGDYYRDQAEHRLGWSADKLHVIGNWVDTQLMDRPKLPPAAFNLGMIGIAPSRKRLDLGLDILEHLRLADDRYQLFVKSKMPWEYWWIWKKEDEQAHYQRIFERLRSSPELENAVVFDGFGPDVPAWLRKIGYVLSTSDDESFHLAPAEGMASGAVPMLLDWPGSRAIYPDAWVHETPEAVAEHILAINRDREWAERGEACKRFAQREFAIREVCAEWLKLLG